MPGLDISSKSSRLLPASFLSGPLRSGPVRSAGFVCSISERPWRRALGCAPVWRFPTAGQFSSRFVVVWFVEHVVYGEGQMNGHVTRAGGRGGYTLCPAFG